MWRPCIRQKAELSEIENQTGSQKYQQHLNDVMEDYEVRQNKLEDDRSRYSELKSKMRETAYGICTYFSRAY